MQIGIIGVGVIGGSLRKWFLENTEHELRLYDPQKGFTDSVTSCNVCFICVTCNNDQNGNQDLSQVKAAIKLCDHKSKIFIRSTVLPGTVQALRHEFSMNIFSCPEFLTQRDADSDMYRLPILTSCEDMDYMSHIFPLKAIYTMKHTECEMAKYTHNCFGAMKVGFFNVIYEQCEKLGIDYKEVLRGSRMTGYIEQTHTQVPGPDGKFGFSGACFPKDLQAFNNFIEKTSKLLHGVQIDNHRYRNKRIKGML